VFNNIDWVSCFAMRYMFTINKSRVPLIEYPVQSQPGCIAWDVEATFF